MPTVFKVLESAGRPESYFAYTGPQDQIGEPSVYGTVFRSYRSESSGEALSSGDRWIIKESKSAEYRRDFEFEYNILRDLARVSEQQNGRAFSPHPAYLLERVDNGMPALAMPFYGEEVEQEIYHWSQAELLRVMRDYVRLLISLKKVGNGYTCTDRKQDDLRWDQGHLVVIDWNLLRDATPDFIQTEISIFGRLWYSMLTGRVPTPTLNAFDDAHWQPVTATDSRLIRGLLLGTRLIITRTVQSYYKSPEALDDALRTWLEMVNVPPHSSSVLQTELQVSAARADALFVDLNPRHLVSDAFQNERRIALANAQKSEDPLGDIHAALNGVGDNFRKGDIQSALTALSRVSFTNDVQKAARERWQMLLNAAGSADLGERQDARRFADEWLDALDRLLNRPWNEQILDMSEPLARAEAVYRSGAMRFRGTLSTTLLTFADEAKLRIEMLRVEQAMQQGESAVEALQTISRLRQMIPYADLMMSGFDLEARQKATRQQTESSALLNTQVAAARSATLNWLRRWDTAEAVSNYDALEEIRRAEQVASEISTAAGTDVADRVLAYRKLTNDLPLLRERPPSELVHFASSLRSRFDGELAHVLDGQVNRIIQEQGQKVVRRAEQIINGIERPTSESSYTGIDVAKALSDVSSFLKPDIAERLSDDARNSLNTYLPHLKQQDEFLRSLTYSTMPDTFDVLERAKRARVSIYHPAVWDYTQEALRLSQKAQSGLTHQYAEKANELYGEVTGLRTEFTNNLNQQKRDVNNQFEQVRAETQQNAEAVSALDPRIGKLEKQTDDTAAQHKTTRTITFVIIGLAVLGLIIGISGVLMSAGNGETREQVQALGDGATQVANTLTADDPRQVALEESVEALGVQQVGMQATVDSAVLTLSAPTPTPLPSPTAVPTEATAEVTAEATEAAAPDAAPTEAPAPPQPVTALRYALAGNDRMIFQPFANDNLITIPFDQLVAVTLDATSPFQAPYEAMKTAFGGSEGTLFLVLVGGETIPVIKAENQNLTGYQNVALLANSYNFLRSDNTIASYMPDADVSEGISLPLDVVLLPVDDALRTAITENLGVRAQYLPVDTPINGDYVLALTSGSRLIEVLWGQQIISFARWNVTPSSQDGFLVRGGASRSSGVRGNVKSGEVAQIFPVEQAVLETLEPPTGTRLDILLSKNAMISLGDHDPESLRPELSRQWWYLEATIDGTVTQGWARRDTFDLVLALGSIGPFPLENRITLRPLQQGDT